MSLTAHFIDNDWMLQKKVINFCQVKSHTGKNLTRMVESCLSSWGLTRVLSLTINNATSNDKTIEYMQKRLMSWNRLVLNGNYLHTRCCAHIINLIVQEGFKEDITTICRVHAAVKYVKSSPSRLSKFMECVAHVNIEYKSLVRLDVETRWNSTYLMLEAALKHHKEFEEFKLRDKKFMGMAPTYSDWEFVRSILPFLEIFNYATLRIFGSSYVISTMYMFEAFGIGMKIREMSTSWGVHMSVRTMVIRMKEKYDKYWGNPNHINMLLMISLMLHPSYKLKFTNWLIAKSFDGEGSESTCKLRDKVESSLRSLFEEVENDPHGYSRYFQSTRSSTSELDIYLEDARHNRLDLDVLNCTGGRVLDPYRCSLTPQMVEALVCTQDWIKKTPSPLPSNENDEFLEFERIEEELVPSLVTLDVTHSVSSTFTLDDD
uniref:hAT-like transposase RNase-H fold domain-containing protein n=1 Tax=Glycine max TaxID=3847 RepID=A0A0R0FBB8_SOYBN